MYTAKIQTRIDIYIFQNKRNVDWIQMRKREATKSVKHVIDFA